MLVGRGSPATDKSTLGGQAIRAVKREIGTGMGSTNAGTDVKFKSGCHVQYWHEGLLHVYVELHDMRRFAYLYVEACPYTHLYMSTRRRLAWQCRRHHRAARCRCRRCAGFGMLYLQRVERPRRRIQTNTEACTATKISLLRAVMSCMTSFQCNASKRVRHRL